MSYFSDIEPIWKEWFATRDIEGWERMSRKKREELLSYHRDRLIIEQRAAKAFDDSELIAKIKENRRLSIEAEVMTVGQLFKQMKEEMK